MAIRIVTDSSADLPPELARRSDITVVPCYVMLGDRSHRDGLDITPDEFYRHLVSSPRLPTTAQPSVADFQAVYGDLLGQGHQVLSIHISQKLSGTLNSAERARALLGNAGAGRVEIVDSRLASISLGLVALAAAQAAQSAQAAGSLQGLASRVRQDLPLTHGLFMLDTLEYLQKGGRIGKAQAFLGSVLGVKPILRLQDGEVHPVERLRNRERAVGRLIAMARELAPARRLAVVHSTSPDQAAALRHRLADLLPFDEIVSTRFGPALGTYVGPGALGIGLTCAEAPAGGGFS
jgi:DegV family protein with EDD domain